LPRPSKKASSSRPRSGQDPLSLNSGYGEMDRSIKKGDPFRKGTGLISMAYGFCTESQSEGTE